MTLIYPIEQKCAVCGQRSEQWTLASTNQNGYADLDFRPPEMERSTMSQWIQRCPHCGYCNSEIKKKTKVSKKYLLSEKYRTLFPEIDPNSLAASFLYMAKICRKDKRFHYLPYCYLQAAWACDDEDNANGAIQCRLAAIKAFKKYRKNIKVDMNYLLCVKTDLLRRTGKFSKAQTLVEKHLAFVSDPTIRAILKFQIEKCKTEDTNCYTIEDAKMNIDSSTFFHA